MKRCNSCKIDFNINEDLCPLCQDVLEGECLNLHFPQKVKRRKKGLVLKILFLVFFVITIICMFINNNVSGKITWSKYVILGLITAFFVMRFTLKNTNNVLSLIGKYGIVIVLFLLIWYFYTKSTILTNFIIPSICIVELIYNVIVAISLKKYYFIRYSGIMFANIFLLIVPSIMVFFNLTTNNTLAYICLNIMSLVTFFFYDIKEELKKVFNI